MRWLPTSGQQHVEQTYPLTMTFHTSQLPHLGCFGQMKPAIYQVLSYLSASFVYYIGLCSTAPRMLIRPSLHTPDALTFIKSACICMACCAANA